LEIFDIGHFIITFFTGLLQLVSEIDLDLMFVLGVETIAVEQRTKH